MPNHVTSHLRIEAHTIDEIKDFVKKYRTKHPAKVGRSYSGDIRYKKDDGSRWGQVGFLNEETGEFSWRERVNDEWVDKIQQGIPEGYEVDIDEEWSQFPDFNKIIPMPEHGDDFYAEGGLGDKEKKKYGSNNWYDWSIENWGTKWNSYSHDIVQEISWAPDSQRYVMVCKFETAWSAVVPLIKKMAENNPKVDITYVYADEDMGYNTGIVKFKDGSVVQEEYPEGGSKEAMKLYFETHPDRLDDFVFNDDGTYEHKEDL